MASSIELVGAERMVYTDGVVRKKCEYRGLKADFDKLPTDDDLGTGSSCLFLDTKEYAEYMAYNKTWYLL
jgi:hypothetical protein